MRSWVGSIWKNICHAAEKSICVGCMYSLGRTGNDSKCPFCNSEGSDTDEEKVKEIMKRVEVNDPVSIELLANSYHHGRGGLQQDNARAIELYVRAAELGYSMAHTSLAGIYFEVGDLKKAKFHYESAAMAGDEVARFHLGVMEFNSGNKERAVKHFTIAASAGYYHSMHHLITLFKQGVVSRDSIDSTLTAYNNSCKEMRSEARNAVIQS
jgi:TPR repeat protein